VVPRGIFHAESESAVVRENFYHQKWSFFGVTINTYIAWNIVQKIIEFGLFQAFELELDDRIAILTRISHAEAAEFRNITRFNGYMRNTS